MSQKFVLKVKSYDEIKGALFDIMQERDFLLEKLIEVDKIIGSQIDILRIDQKKEGFYKVSLSYQQIQRLRECLSQKQRTESDKHE